MASDIYSNKGSNHVTLTVTTFKYSSCPNGILIAFNSHQQLEQSQVNELLGETLLVCLKRYYELTIGTINT